VCLSFAYLKDVCFYAQLAKRSHSLLGGREPGDGCMVVRERLSNYHYLALSVSADEVGGKG
jgi:hypothetical protein